MEKRVCKNKKWVTGSNIARPLRLSQVLQISFRHPAVVAPGDVQDRQAGDSRGKGAPALAPKKT